MIGSIITDINSDPIGAGTVGITPANNFSVAGSPTNYSFGVLAVFSLEDSDPEIDSYHVVFCLMKQAKSSPCQELANITINAESMPKEPGKSSILSVKFNNVTIDDLGVYTLKMKINNEEIAESPLQFTKKSSK